MAASDEVSEVSIVIHNDGNSSFPVDLSEEDEWWGSMRRIEDKEEKPKQSPKIRRVPEILRQKKSSRKGRCYDPFVVSIGPYHHDKPDLQEVERLKIPLARQYVKDCNRSLEVVYGKVEEVSNHARGCYPDDATSKIDDTKFTRMMFLDGCFILQFLDSLSRGEPMKGLKTNLVAFVQRDLFLLENQLPYQVLQALMSLRFKETERRLLINRFIYATRGLNNRHPSLIERVARKLNFKAKPARMELPREPDNSVHLLDIFRSRFINKIDLMGCHRKGKAGYWYSYPAAKELKAMGIHFKSSNEDRFTDIRFKGYLTAGVLTLPRIILDDTTMSMLLNLVAYEACPDTPDDFGITSYVCFMDSLIDEAKDVEELRKKHIIYNMLANDHEAAELFNDVAKDLVPSPCAFIDVKERIETHYKNKCKTNISEWLNSHFESPWTLIALLAATFAILLSFVQTYLAWVDFCLGENHFHFWCPFPRR